MTDGEQKALEILARELEKEESILLKDAADGTGDSDAAFERMLPQLVLEKSYVRNFVPQERIDLYKELSAEYKEAMRARIEGNDWLGEETKKEAYRRRKNPMKGG